MTTNIAYAKSVDVGHYSSGCADAAGMISQRHKRVYKFRYAGDSAANVNVSETQCGGIGFDFAGHITDLYVKADSNVALNTSNYGFLNFGIISNGSLSRTNATLATVNTAVAALTAYTRSNATFASDILRDISAGDALTYVQSKPGGTGVQMPVFTVTCVVEDT